MGSERPEIIPVFGNSFGEDDLRAVGEVLKSHLVGMGEVTARFEDEFKKRIGFKHAAGVSSCTDGFWLLLKALGLGPEDEVIVPNTHFFGIKNVLELLNIPFRVVDVGWPVPNITLAAVKSQISPRTKAIIFLEYGGYPVAEIQEIKRFLHDHHRSDVRLILDAANSPFSVKDGSYSARAYDYAIYSFDMNKLLVTGDGGMVLADDEQIMRAVKSLSYYGVTGPAVTGFEKSRISDVWWETEVGEPSLLLCMNNVAAALGLSQMRNMDRVLEKRKQLAAFYCSSLRPLAASGVVELPPVLDRVENNLYLFWLTLRDQQTRNELARFLIKNNIYSTVKYEPLDKAADTPKALDFFGRALNIPFNQNLTQAQRRLIVAKVKEFFHHEN
jgi:dTDP-4-amino-4,6-dideoxygalactose transaminase